MDGARAGTGAYPDQLKHYAEGLTIYLDHSGATPGAIALKLQEQLNSVLKEHPDYYLVNFLMAAAFANVGSVPRIFSYFLSILSALSNPLHGL